MDTTVNLPLAQQVARLFVVRASGCWSDSQRGYPRWEAGRDQLRHWLSALGVGGVILLDGHAAEVQQRIRWLRQCSDHPLLICADVEEGVGQRFPGATWLPPPFTLGRAYNREPAQAIAWARCYGQRLGLEARMIGLNWVLAPVCDVNNNPRNPVINVRAFGDTAAVVTPLVAAFCDGLESAGVLGCAKHFPGHGDTTRDSHLVLPQVDAGRRRLDTTELPPFAAAIDSGCAAVMTGHLLVPALDDAVPASFSRTILEDLLRQQLGFQGLIVSDALVMAGAAQGEGDPALAALQAGCDLLLMPSHLEASIAAICSAVEAGRLPVERIQSANRRRDAALARLASATADNTTAADPLLALEGLEGDEAQALDSAMLQSDLSVRGRMTPLATAQTGTNLMVVDDGRLVRRLMVQAPARQHPEAWSFSPLLWTSDRPIPPLQGPILLQLWRRGQPFQGSAGLPAGLLEHLQLLLAHRQLHGVALYGSPWIAAELRRWLPQSMPMGFCCAGTPRAQELLLTRLLPEAQPQPSPSSGSPASFTD